MKILFVYPDIISGRVYSKHISHGLTSLSAVLKAQNHVTNLCHLVLLDLNLLVDKILTFNPDVVAISTTTNQWEYSKEIARCVKENFKLPVFIGGIHPTVYPECIGESPNIDGICRGEGEQALLELVSALEKNESIFSIKNFWFRNSGNIVKNEMRPLLENLDELPYPDLDLFDFQYLIQSAEGARFSFSRGCPFRCSYCVNATLQEIYRQKGKYVRRKTVNRALGELEATVDKYDFSNKYLLFDDDIFTLDEDWVMTFCDQYKKRISLPFVCNVRCGTVKEVILKKIKEAGCFEVRIGIESGDTHIRNKVLNRHMTDEEIIKTFSIARKAGLNTYAFNMVGIPGETPDAFRRTVELNRQAKPDKLGISILYPYPGTEIETMCKNKNLINPDKTIDNYFEGSILQLLGFPEKKILKAKRRFQVDVFRKYSLKKTIKAFVYYIFDELPPGIKNAIIMLYKGISRGKRS